MTVVHWFVSLVIGLLINEMFWLLIFILLFLIVTNGYVGKLAGNYGVPVIALASAIQHNFGSESKNMNK